MKYGRLPAMFSLTSFSFRNPTERNKCVFERDISTLGRRYESCFVERNTVRFCHIAVFHKKLKEKFCSHQYLA